MTVILSCVWAIVNNISGDFQYHNLYRSVICTLLLWKKQMQNIWQKYDDLVALKDISSLLTLPVTEDNDENMRNFPCPIEKHCARLHHYEASCLWHPVTLNDPAFLVRDHIKIYTKQQVLFQPSFVKSTIYSAVESGQRKTRDNDDTVVQDSEKKVEDDQFVRHEQESPPGEHLRASNIFEKQVKLSVAKVERQGLNPRCHCINFHILTTARWLSREWWSQGC